MTQPETNPRASNTARLLRALSRRKRGKLPRQVWPESINRAYARTLVRVVDRVRGLTQPLFDALPAMFPRVDGERADAFDGRRLRLIFAALRNAIGNELPLAGLDAIARNIGRDVSQWNERQLRRQIRAAFGADVFAGSPALADTIDRFAIENVALINDVPRKLVNDLEATVTRAVSSGTLHTDLAKELEGKFGFARKRAKIIARDQVGKLYGRVNAERQKSMGVTHFVWRSVGDRRVRPQHRARNGNRYAYDDPPDGEIPGEPILCRCYPEPDFSAVLDLI